MTDPRDGRKYKTVKIGNKVWMAENLRNGDISHYSANNYRGNDKMYGYLYTWENAKKACPSGWRLPTKNEFYQLLKATGATNNSSSIRATSWKNGSNSCGFGAQPTGYMHSDGRFGRFGFGAFFWSATPDADYSDYAYNLLVGSGSADIHSYSVLSACSVRCVKD